MRIRRLTLINRLSSGLLTLAIVSWAFVQSVSLGLAALAFYGGSCSLIWFGDAIGQFTPFGHWRGASLTPRRLSNGNVVAAVGWFFLVGLPLLFLYVFKDFRP